MLVSVVLRTLITSVPSPRDPSKETTFPFFTQLRWDQPALEEVDSVYGAAISFNTAARCVYLILFSLLCLLIYLKMASTILDLAVQKLYATVTFNQS